MTSVLAAASVLISRCPSEWHISASATCKDDVTYSVQQHGTMWEIPRAGATHVLCFSVYFFIGAGAAVVVLVEL
jgi:hypothetical protein